jgi:heme exporter protein D
MPDLAGYAGTVLGAYAVTLALLALLVALTWGRSVRVRRQLAEVEARGKRRDDG